MNLRRFTLFGLAALLGLAATFVALLYSRPHVFAGSSFEPPVPAADFALPDQHGETFRLSEQQGKAVLLFFGYTHCPDICPVTLAALREVKTLLGEQAERVRVVFVTTDPERDTPSRLGEYLKNFDAEFLGLSGSRQELEPVWQAYGVYQAREEDHDSDLEEAAYTVDHSTRVYAIDPQGNLRLTFWFGIESQAMAADVRALLREP